MITRFTTFVPFVALHIVLISVLVLQPQCQVYAKYKVTQYEGIPRSLQETKSISTFFLGGSAQTGVMFDIIAKRKLTVTGFDIHTASVVHESFETWTKKGSFQGHSEDISVWNMIGCAVILGNGFGSPTQVSSDILSWITIEENETYGIYITFRTGYLQYTPSYFVGSAITGDVYVESDDLQFVIGVGKTYLFGSGTFSDRIFNGAIFYVLGSVPRSSPILSSECRPSAFPSLQPTLSPIITTMMPSHVPSLPPTIEPTLAPSTSPTAILSTMPSTYPTLMFTKGPSSSPTMEPTYLPSLFPSVNPSTLPSYFPSLLPSIEPVMVLSESPSVASSSIPSTFPTIKSSTFPSDLPTLKPTPVPSMFPTTLSSVSPSIILTRRPSTFPTIMPSFNPTAYPTRLPTIFPSVLPSDITSKLPTFSPSTFPSISPSEPNTTSPSLHNSSQPTWLPTSPPSAEDTFIMNVSGFVVAAIAGASASAAAAASSAPPPPPPPAPIADTSAATAAVVAAGNTNAGVNDSASDIEGEKIIKSDDSYYNRSYFDNNNNDITFAAVRATAKNNLKLYEKLEKLGYLYEETSEEIFDLDHSDSSLSSAKPRKNLSASQESFNSFDQTFFRGSPESLSRLRSIPVHSVYQRFHKEELYKGPFLGGKYCTTSSHGLTTYNEVHFIEIIFHTQASMVRILSWFKMEGQNVYKGESIAAVECTNSSNSTSIKYVTAPIDGIIATLRCEEGALFETGDTVAFLVKNITSFKLLVDYVNLDNNNAENNERSINKCVKKAPTSKKMTKKDFLVKFDDIMQRDHGERPGYSVYA